MFDIHQSPCDECGEWDESEVEDYCNELIEAFAASPEGEAVAERYGGVGWADSFLYYGFNYLGSAPPKMSRRDVKKVLFDLFPRKVSTTADTAEEIIAEVRAFWEFLQREYGLTNATGILQDLGDGAARRLARELDDPRNFGMAKSFVMAGHQAGFDMTTREGIDAFMQTYNAAIEARGFGGPPPAQRQALPQEHPQELRYSREPQSKPKPFATRLSPAERRSREKLRRAKFGKHRRRR